MDMVMGVDPALSHETIRVVLAKTAPFPGSLHPLAAHLAANPNVFSVGPTSTVAVLDRFTRGLISAGSERLRTIHPVCEHCSRQRPWHAGGLCRPCWKRSDKQACPVCGMIRRLGHRDPDGVAICDYCVDRQRRRLHPVELADRIVAVVMEADGSLNRKQVLAALDRSVRGVVARTVIVDELADGPSLTHGARRHAGVARLLAELRAEGAALLAAVCEDCSGPAEPLITYCAAATAPLAVLAAAGSTPSPARCGVSDAEPNAVAPGAHARTAIGPTGPSIPTIGADNAENRPSIPALVAARPHPSLGTRLAGCATAVSWPSSSTKSSVLPGNCQQSLPPSGPPSWRPITPRWCASG
jgi:hypothetical protein